ncbi:unnamed protein product [Darwinula stevensoni]|uniref:Ornithine decarboxylase antizyme n=1 Tax=Darwinula stevensoni TaxID=69355 RepID=A0A7R8XBU2_9CRUS|nr:unnamed protein product [Darwinula stevensoni]CAG0891343.1 unnamed protein product [Darwinula stevensoni]
MVKRRRPRNEVSRHLAFGIQSTLRMGLVPLGRPSLTRYERSRVRFHSSVPLRSLGGRAMGPSIGSLCFEGIGSEATIFDTVKLLFDGVWKPGRDKKLAWPFPYLRTSSPRVQAKVLELKGLGSRGSQGEKGGMNLEGENGVGGPEKKARGEERRVQRISLGPWKYIAIGGDAFPVARDKVLPFDPNKLSYLTPLEGIPSEATEYPSGFGASVVLLMTPMPPTYCQAFAAQRAALAEATAATWNTLLWRHKLFVSVPPGLMPQGSKESFVSLLEFAEEVLECTQVIVYFPKSSSDRALLVKTFMFLGFSLVAPGMDISPLSPDQIAMVYSIE